MDLFRGVRHQIQVQRFFCFLLKIENKAMYGIYTPMGPRGGHIETPNSEKNTIKF